MASFLAAMSMALPESAWKWIHGLGGPGLIFLGILDNTPFISAPPGSIDLFVILLAAHRHDWWAWAYYALMATIGEVMGGYLTYRLAEKGGQVTLEKKVGKSRAQKLYKAFEKHGSATVLVGSLVPPPFPFTSVLITAGVMQHPKNKFLVALTAGRTLRFFIAAGLSHIYGRQIANVFSAHYNLMVRVLVILAIATAAGTAAYFAWFRPKLYRGQQQAPHSPASTSGSAR
jgi:membrane protein YqaA with SNARE-associated domain